MSYSEHFDRIRFTLGSCSSFFRWKKFIGYLLDETLGSGHHIVPTFACLWLILSKFDSRLLRLLLEGVQRAAFKDTAALLPQPRIKPDMAIRLLITIPLHHAYILPRLAGAIKITAAYKCELFIFQPQTNLFGLFNAQFC